MIWTGWKKFAHKFGVFQTYLILTLLYILIVGIASALSRLVRRDLLDRRFRVDPPFWKIKEESTPDLENARRQF